MSIGKNSILRVQNAEKNGAAPIVNEAPDMENSTPLAPKSTPKKKTTKKPTGAPKGNTVKKSSPNSSVGKKVTDLCPVGQALPIYLL